MRERIAKWFFFNILDESQKESRERSWVDPRSIAEEIPEGISEGIHGGFKQKNVVVPGKILEGIPKIIRKSLKKYNEEYLKES